MKNYTQQEVTALELAARVDELARLTKVTGEALNRGFFSLLLNSFAQDVNAYQQSRNEEIKQQLLSLLEEVES